LFAQDAATPPLQTDTSFGPAGVPSGLHDLTGAVTLPFPGHEHDGLQQSQYPVTKVPSTHFPTVEVTGDLVVSAVVARGSVVDVVVDLVDVNVVDCLEVIIVCDCVVVIALLVVAVVEVGVEVVAEVVRGAAVVEEPWHQVPVHAAQFAAEPAHQSVEAACELHVPHLSAVGAQKQQIDWTRGGGAVVTPVPPHHVPVQETQLAADTAHQSAAAAAAVQVPHVSEVGA
jgi:hypothetical protein